MQIHTLLQSRNELGKFFNWLGLTGEGVEIGVLYGEYSLEILRHWNGHTLHLVDAWSNALEDYADPASGLDMEQAYQRTLGNIEPYRARVKIHRLLSIVAVSQFSDNSLDFVYIDADHCYESAKKDIAVWSEKVRPGGVICGHDYCTSDNPLHLIGVERAVREFCEERGVEELLLTQDNFPSWFIRKI
jgi:hypothetical protein